MRALTTVVVCSVILAAPLAGADRERPRNHWLRRITWAAGCAASFWDAQTTLSAVRHGAAEGNPLLGNEQGAPRWGRIIALKAGTCATTFVVQSVTTRHGGADWYWSTANVGIAAAFSAAAIHNIQVSDRLAKDNQRPN
jgi:hypothetical protein